MQLSSGLVRLRGIGWLWVLLAVSFVSCGEDDPTRPPEPPPSFEVVDWAYHMNPDGSRVIYRHRASRDRIGGVYILEIGDTITQTLLFADSLPFFASDCRFSPDGKRVVYTRDFRSDIYVRDLSDSTDTQVTFTYGNARSPDWDPTGRYIVYMRIFLDYGMPDSSAGLHIVDTESMTDTSLKAAGNVVFGTDPRWSRDGSQIAFSVLTTVPPSTIPNKAHIWAARADRTAMMDLTPGDGRHNQNPEWLTSGQVTFESYGETSQAEHNTQSIAPDGTGRRTLPVDVRPYIAYGAIAATAGQCAYTGPDTAGKYGVLYTRHIEDAAGTTTRQLTTYVPPDSGLTQSPPNNKRGSPPPLIGSSIP